MLFPDEPSFGGSVRLSCVVLEAAAGKYRAHAWPQLGHEQTAVEHVLVLHFGVGGVPIHAGDVASKAATPKELAVRSSRGRLMCLGRSSCATNLASGGCEPTGVISCTIPCRRTCSQTPTKREGSQSLYLSRWVMC